MPERLLPWLRRTLGFLLVGGALYLIAIAQLSPHPLPGLVPLAGSVFFVGLTNPFIGTRFRRVELVLCALAALCAVLALLSIGGATAAMPRKH